MVRLLQHFRRLARDERGVAMILFAMTVLILIPVAGGALDYSSALTVQARAAAAADAAALAIASRSQTDKEKATRLAEALLAAQYPVSQRNGATINTPVVDVSVKGRVGVTISGSVPSLFLGVIGIAELEVNARAEAKRGAGQNVDVVMVLDNTGSMGGSRLSSLKEAAKQIPELLLKDSEDTKTDNTVQIGMVPFSMSVNVGSAREAAWLEPLGDPPPGGEKPKFTGCVLARTKNNGALTNQDLKDSDHLVGGVWKPLQFYSGCIRTAILPLTKDKEAIKGVVDSMTALGFTAVPLGLAWGWRVLSPTEPFTEGQVSKEGEPPVRRVLILLSDGENILDERIDSAYGFDSPSTSQLNSKTKTLCSNIKNDKIQIYTINFLVDTDAHKTLMRDCASDQSSCGGPCNFEATTTTIKDVFKDIAKDLRRTRLTH